MEWGHSHDIMLNDLPVGDFWLECHPRMSRHARLAVGDAQDEVRDLVLLHLRLRPLRHGEAFLSGERRHPDQYERAEEPWCAYVYLHGWDWATPTRNQPIIWFIMHRCIRTCNTSSSFIRNSSPFTPRSRRLSMVRST